MSLRVHIVQYDPAGSADASRVQRRAARAHIGKLNRAKGNNQRLGPTRSGPGPADQRASDAGNHRTSNSAMLGRGLGDLDGGYNTGSRVERQSLALPQPWLPSAVYTSATLPRPLSPIFGAYMSSCAEASDEPQTAEVGHRVLTLTLAPFLLPGIVPFWFQGFVGDALLYNAFTYLYYFMQERKLRSSLPPAQKRNMLACIVNVTRMINERLATLADGDVETVLLAMCLLVQHQDLDEGSGIRPAEETLFIPPTMVNSDMLDQGKLGYAVSFLPAVSALLQRVGGLECIRDRGLRSVLCTCDLILASQHFTRPIFECCWSLHESVFVLGLSEELLFVEESHGSGFLRPPLQSIPHLSVFTTLSAIDRVMARCQGAELSRAETKLLNDARSFAKHSTLSLPAWSSLTDNDKGSFDRVELYESCRAVATIYSNTVIFPIPARCAGIRSAVLALREILETCDLEVWAEEAPGYVLWLLLVGGLAAYRTRHWSFFVAALEKWIRMCSITTFESIETMANDYIWSSEACREGAAILWAAAICDVNIV
ncbi:hypothetical protein LTR56_015141 [Elasticomyces elasticus]|nr:hypothetical protein LTR56_015141 [Elasticomyces elasticus]KAK3651983.1 hypothetical protein LTR22_011913 [Elasticomyces elasticus]KAK4919064.1 hypothetical protein LTR49_013235 [Elasticomyces elasticus]KAK5765704.1 hypothetical protein LTS12_004210 [Elasticomyces elasticus]